MVPHPTPATSPAFSAGPRSIAIVRLRTGLGDLLCTVPALRALRARLPEAHVALVTFAEMAPVVDRLAPWVDELVPFPGFPGIPERPPDTDAIEPFFAAARARRFDLALQMYGANTAANVVTARLGARRTGGFVMPGEWAGDPRTHLAYPEREHEVRRHLALMARLGAPSRGDALELALDAGDERAARELRRETGLQAPYVCVHPGATSPSRVWPAERFAAVADALAERGLRVAITGVVGEAALVAAVRRRMRRPAVALAGRTTLGSFAVLLRDAALVVTNDTGAAHLATAVGARSVTVFLSGDPRRWSGLHGERHLVARADVGCNPCRHLACPIDHRCATRLPAAEVLARADALLA